MNSELIMQSDVLDILFENRNKDYGAYIIRKFYNKRLFRSLGIMVCTVLVIAAFSLLTPNPVKPVDFIVTENGFADFPPPPKLPELKPLVKKLPKIPQLSTSGRASNLIFVELKDSAHSLPDLDEPATGNSIAVPSGSFGSQLVMPSAAGGTGFNEPANTSEPIIDPAKPVDNPDIMPQYPGGMEALRKFLVANLHSPGNLLEGESISVKVKFVVGYDGKLQGFELLEDGGREFNNEVIRVLKKMPAWIPGRSRGRNVSVYHTIPVKFIGEG